MITRYQTLLSTSACAATSGPLGRAHAALNRFIKHKAFDNFIIVLILVSSMLLAIDSPKVDPDSMLKTVLDILDLFFVITFTIEVRGCRLTLSNQCEGLERIA
jgi:hypothetical protein